MKKLDDLEELAIYDPIVRKFLLLHRYNEEEVSLQDALINMVFHLVEDRNTYMDKLIHELQNSRSPRLPRI